MPELTLKDIREIADKPLKERREFIQTVYEKYPERSPEVDDAIIHMALALGIEVNTHAIRELSETIKSLIEMIKVENELHHGDN